MTRFPCSSAQQLAERSMPRNSLTNGKSAPASLQHPARRVLLPAVIWASPVGLTGRDYYARTSRPAANFVASQAGVRAERWEEQERLLALDDRGRDRGLVAAREHRRPQRRHGPARVARRGRRLPAQSMKVDADHERAARAARTYFIRLLEDRRPERGVSYNVGKRRPDARPARGHRRRLPRVTPASVVMAEHDAGPRVRSLPDRRPSVIRRAHGPAGVARLPALQPCDGYGDRLGDGQPWAADRPRASVPLWLP
jgi:hypothetical protein